MIKEDVNILMSKPEIIIFDTETTGLDAEKCNIIQISAIKYNVNGKAIEEKDRMNMYINPGYPLPEIITKITGITDAVLASEPTEPERFEAIYNFFGEIPAISGYNVKFDIKFMQQMYMRQFKKFVPIVADTFEMVKDLIPKNVTENQKLATMAHYFKVDEGLVAHDSMNDTLMTAEIFKIMIKHYLENPSETVILSVADDSPKIENFKIISMHFWEGYRGYSRIYITTDKGTFFYDIRNASWGCKIGNLGEINIAKFQEAVFAYAGITGLKELAHWKG